MHLSLEYNFSYTCLTNENIIFDILEQSSFKKYNTCWVALPIVHAVQPRSLPDANFQVRDIVLGEQLLVDKGEPVP